MQTGQATNHLVKFVQELRYEDLPGTVIERAKDLLIDWLGAALAGRQSRPVQAFRQFSAAMGPTDGPSQLLTDTHQGTSPWFAALVNAASSHVVEQDDVHNGSVFHPGAVVIPPVMAIAQAAKGRGKDLVLSVVVGYEMGVRVGRFLGTSHYKVFHTTGTAGTLAAAGAASRMLGLDGERLRHALGSAGTQAAGLWEFLRDAADSKQLHTAKAASNGLLAAYTAQWGLTGARQILEGPQGLGRGMSQETFPEFLSSGLGTRWAVLETSVKWHASCRHTHPSADALQQLMAQERLAASDLLAIEAHVHRAAIDVLQPAAQAATTHQAKFSMPFVLALIATKGHASIEDFHEEALRDPTIRDLMPRIRMVYDPEVDRAYPERWMGKVRVTTLRGVFEHRIAAPLGDPDNFLTRSQLKEKAVRIAQFGSCSPAQTHRAIEMLEHIEQMDPVPWLIDPTIG